MLIQKDVDLQKSELPEMCSFKSANYAHEFMSLVLLNVYVYTVSIVNIHLSSLNSQTTKPLTCFHFIKKIVYG